METDRESGACPIYGAPFPEVHRWTFGRADDNDAYAEYAYVDAFGTPHITPAGLKHFEEALTKGPDAKRIIEHLFDGLNLVFDEED